MSHRFVDTFENVYGAPSLQVPWYFNAGNHDWHTVANTTAELAYAVAKGRKTTRWNMPNYYYVHSETFTTAAGASVSVDWVRRRRKRARARAARPRSLRLALARLRPLS